MKNKGKKSEEPTEEKKEIVDEINLDETFPEAGSQLEETELNESFLHMQKLAGLITESEYKKKVQALNEEESLQQYAQKIANQHNLMLLPQPLEKPALYNMWKKEKGSFGDKEGVMTFIPNSKIVNVLSSDEKIPGAVFAQFKTDRGGNDQGFETKTFSPRRNGLLFVNTSLCRNSVLALVNVRSPTNVGNVVLTILNFKSSF